MMINPDYAEPILTIANSLSDLGIPYTTNIIWDGLQLRFPWCGGDVVCHSGSYGHSSKEVESYCFPWDKDDVSQLEVEEAIQLIAYYYYKTVHEE